MAGIFLAIVAAITFVSVLFRYVFHMVLPDGFDVGRQMLGIAVFWGIAGAAYRGDHIQVDILWGALGDRSRRVLDVFSSLLTLGALAALAWMMYSQVASVWTSNQTTFDLQIPIWPFQAVAWTGLALAAVLVLVRLVRPALPEP
jgi:TRAP-type C4-dicarboxylate transport system permease small subunit